MRYSDGRQGQSSMQSAVLFLCSVFQGCQYFPIIKPNQPSLCHKKTKKTKGKYVQEKAKSILLKIWPSYSCDLATLVYWLRPVSLACLYTGRECDWLAGIMVMTCVIGHAWTQKLPYMWSYCRVHYIDE